jgi:3-isopropylmalate/(R)-2-methylmalate dehydratase small subunit
VISTSFGEIFYANCFKNGIVPVEVTPENLILLMADAEAKLIIDVNLSDQCIRRLNAEPIPFQVEPWRREALLNGWDEIAIVLKQDTPIIADFERSQRAARPWLYQGD